jgi:hypothetical protein
MTLNDEVAKRFVNSGTRLTLVSPPLGDPTLPYHSTAYLAGSLIAAGFDNVVQRDANAEFVDWCLSERTFINLIAECRDRTKRLGAQMALRPEEQGQFYELWCRRDISWGEVAGAVGIQRTLDRFLEFEAYSRSVQVIGDYFRLIGALSYPAAIDDFVLISNGRFSFTSFDDLLNENLSHQVCWPFYRFLDEIWANDAHIAATACLGISIAYQHQLYHALALARWFRGRWPGKKLFLGGTEISQIYRSVRDREALRSFFSLCDGFVVGEAETAICELADCGFDVAPGSNIRNLVTFDRTRDRLYLPQKIFYEDLRCIAPPRYEQVWDLYLSPVRAINYSPTRGCYWNRCTYCSYGLNEDGPTAPWRVRPIELAAQELANTAEQQNINYVYFAVDAISPAYLDRLADALLERNTKFKWSAELRLEKVFQRDLCSKLARSGCVSALFGMESGCQRVLDAMDKGTKVDHMRESMRYFADAGIAVQLMTFSGFPTETHEDRVETLRFLEKSSEFWSNGGLGSFVLLDGSIIAKEPQRFGLQLKTVDNCDINAIRAFEVLLPGGEGGLPTDADQSIVEKINSLFPRSHPRPWAGGADTLHSMVYYHCLGPRFFREHSIPGKALKTAPDDDELLGRCSIRLRAGLQECFFDMRSLLSGLESSPERIARLQDDSQAATQAACAAVTAQIQSLSRKETPSYFMADRRNCIEIPTLAFALIDNAVTRSLTVAEMCEPLPAGAVPHFLLYLRKLEHLGMMEFVQGHQGL